MRKYLPRLIVGGASKSGTTAIYYYLRQHPGFCLSEKKELHFFSRQSLERMFSGPGDRFVFSEIPKTIAEYLSFFSHCEDERIAVDVSPSYLYHYSAADDIKRYLGTMRIVFILRNPADKAFSQYLHLLGAGRETLTFENALAAEPDRERQGYADIWLYRGSGYYADALEHYISVFGRENVALFYYEEFLKNPDTVLRDLCKFAGVDPGFRFAAVEDVNRSGVPRSSLVAKLVGPTALTYLLRRLVPRALGRSVRRLVKEWNTGTKPAFEKRLRQELLEGYRDDIQRTETLVGRASGWMI